MKRTVMIFGVSGFVGSNLAEALKGKFRIIGTYYRTRVRIPGVLTIPCDVLEKDRVNMLINTYKPHYTVYVVGLNSIEICHKHDKLADALNTAGVVNVAEASERIKSKLCYISTDFVFSGHNVVYSEKDNPDPNTQYGKSKVGAEFYIQKSCLNYLIIRSCCLYGRGLNPRDFTWYEMLERKIIQGESFAIDNVVHNGFLDVAYVAAILRLCFEKEITNRLVQLSSTDSMTRYEFAKAYCKLFGTNENLLTKGTWSFPEIDYISADKHVPGDDFYYEMEYANMEALLSIELPSIEESLTYSFQRWGGHTGKSQKTEKSEMIKYL